MRMWMINPKLLCDRHLLGEHGELHKHKPSFLKRHSITGRIYPIVQVEPLAMEKRHNQLAKEMLLRGMNHNSPYQLPDLSYLPNNERRAKVDTKLSIQDLTNRCINCKQLIMKEQANYGRPTTI